MRDGIHGYQSGFGSELATEALPGALPVGRNSPQRWLYAEQFSVTAFTGHTPTSVALFDAANRRLFIGDFVYPTTLYAFLPGASLSAYQTTARMLLEMLPTDSVLWTAHCCRKNEGVSAPWLSTQDLRDLDATLTAVRAGQAKATGFYPRVFPVNEEMTLATGFPWNNR